MCLLIGACGRRCHSSCANVCLACRTIVGKQSEDPRSCWKEMIGFRTRWPLCDRWLGAGLAVPKSPTHTYVGLHNLEHTRTHTFRKAWKMSTHALTYMYACENTYEERLWSLSIYVSLVIREKPIGNIVYLQNPQIHKHKIMTLKQTGK